VGYNHNNFSQNFLQWQLTHVKDAIYSHFNRIAVCQTSPTSTTTPSQQQKQWKKCWPHFNRSDSTKGIVSKQWAWRHEWMLQWWRQMEKNEMKQFDLVRDARHESRWSLNSAHGLQKLSFRKFGLILFDQKV